MYIETQSCLVVHVFIVYDDMFVRSAIEQCRPVVSALSLYCAAHPRRPHGRTDNAVHVEFRVVLYSEQSENGKSRIRSIMAGRAMSCEWPRPLLRCNRCKSLVIISCYATSSFNVPCPSRRSYCHNGWTPTIFGVGETSSAIVHSIKSSLKPDL